jgi:FixJ family two-component response regulator
VKPRASSLIFICREKAVWLHQQLLADGDQIPVIFITAFPERFREYGERASAIGFLRKPFRDEDLIDCLARASRRHRLT